jgi:hypothetical protein
MEVRFWMGITIKPFFPESINQISLISAFELNSDVNDSKVNINDHNEVYNL